MKTIWKYPLIGKGTVIETVVNPRGDESTSWKTAILLPLKSKILYVGHDQVAPCLWVEVDTEHVPEPHVFQVIGTGHPIPENGTYLGTTTGGEWTKFPGRVLVWHVYEVH